MRKKGHRWIRPLSGALCLWVLFAAAGLLSAHRPADAERQAYFVCFADRGPGTPGPEAPSARAQARRALHGFPQCAESDRPLDPAYLAEVRTLGPEIRFELRWFNAVSVNATPAQIDAVRRLPFVRYVRPVEQWEQPAPAGMAGEEGDSLKEIRALRNQRQLMQLDSLRARGLDGTGVRIAVFDAGFTGADEHPGLAHIFKEGRLIDSKDFYGGRKTVFRGSGHGTEVLGCIAGYYKNGDWIGAAPKAEFLLARTEHNWFEKAKEEDCWMAAAEWAERNGADIISSSLGYTKKRYTYADMDGRTALVTRAALYAANHGILVVNAAGNEGADDWHYIAAPADADSILSVGASYPMLGFPMPFSSRGPTVTGLIKPEIAGPGYVLSTHKKGGYSLVPGTSFATPYCAGFAACLKQLMPDATNMELRLRMMATGHRFPYYDHSLGFGVPDARRIDGPLPQEPTFRVERLRDSTFILFDRTHIDSLPSARKRQMPFFYHVASPREQLLVEYAYLLDSNALALHVPDSLVDQGTLRIWFEGYFWAENMPER